MNLFFSPIVEKLKDIEYGKIFKIKKIDQLIKGYVLYGVFDKPARASVFNLIASNGYHSCLKCIQSGSTIKNKNGNSVHVFPYQKNDPSGPERTKLNYSDNLEQLQNNKNFKFLGIKGPTVLFQLAYFTIENIQIDYMHSIMFGVIKSFFDLWFSSEFSSESFTLRSKISLIDKRLLNIRPPDFFPNSPRSVEIFKFWKANEFLYFILFYVPIVFNGLMEPNYYQNILKLVIALHKILSRTSIEELDSINLIFLDFCQELEILYTPLIMKSGFHELLHLADAIRKIGPLNLISCFPYEELNRKTLRFIKGKDLMGEEFHKIFYCSQLLNLYIDQIQLTNFKLRNFIEKFYSINSSNRKNKKNSKPVNFNLRKKVKLPPSLIIDKIKQELKLKNHDEILFVDQIYIKNILFNTSKSKTKFDNSCIATREFKFGLIEYIFIANNKPHAICRQILKIYNPFFYPHNKNLSIDFFIANLTRELFITTFSSLKKSMFVKIEDNEFILNFNSSHLFS